MKMKQSKFAAINTMLFLCWCSSSAAIDFSKPYKLDMIIQATRMSQITNATTPKGFVPKWAEGMLNGETFEERVSYPLTIQTGVMNDDSKDVLGATVVMDFKDAKELNKNITKRMVQKNSMQLGPEGLADLEDAVLGSIKVLPDTLRMEVTCCEEDDTLCSKDTSNRQIHYMKTYHSFEDPCGSEGFTINYYGNTLNNSTAEILSQLQVPSFYNSTSMLLSSFIGSLVCVDRSPLDAWKELCTSWADDGSMLDGFGCTSGIQNTSINKDEFHYSFETFNVTSTVDVDEATGIPKKASFNDNYIMKMQALIPPKNMLTEPEKDQKSPSPPQSNEKIDFGEAVASVQDDIIEDAGNDDEQITIVEDIASDVDMALGIQKAENSLQQAGPDSMFKMSFAGRLKTEYIFNGIENLSDEEIKNTFANC